MLVDVEQIPGPSSTTVPNSSENTDNATSPRPHSVCLRLTVLHKIEYCINMLDNVKQCMTSNELENITSKHLKKLELLLEELRALKLHEDKIDIEERTVIAKKRKLIKHIQDLLQNCNKNDYLRVKSSVRRIFKDNYVLKVNYDVVKKLSSIVNDIDVLCHEMMNHLQAESELSEAEIDKKIKYNPDAGASTSQARAEEVEATSSVGQSSGIELNDDADIDEKLSAEEQEKRKKKNLRRIQQRQERAELEKQKGYKEDATREDYNMWVPPKDQSGDGRTSLNDKYGY